MSIYTVDTTDDSFEIFGDGDTILYSQCISTEANEYECFKYDIYMGSSSIFYTLFFLAVVFTLGYCAGDAIRKRIGRNNGKTRTIS